MTVKLTDKIILGDNKPVLIAGPCVVESAEITLEIANELKTITQKMDIPFIFKASYDKANRTSYNSFRSIGIKPALAILEKVRSELDLPIITDIHEAKEAEKAASMADILQIPAFLCRQTDLLQSAGRTGLPVNIKKGQFMAPGDMKYSIEKVTATGNDKVFLTERGSSFGYHNLVVDMRGLPIMRQFAPVVFDITHSVQMPGGAEGTSGGERKFAPYLAKAAAAVGVDGFFIETHPEPDKAFCDGPNMIPLTEMSLFLEELLKIWHAGRPFKKLGE